jgi:geranylgeranyl pyrophosphate synthase
VNEQLNTINFLIPVQEWFPLVEERMVGVAKEYHPDLGAALKHLLSSGGKRIRVALTLLIGKMFDADEIKLVTLAGAIELLHTATLVHDDLIDGALLRRGIATLNSKWSPAATVLTGDFIFARAAKLAAETDSVAVMHLFSKTLAVVVDGELTQLFSSKGLASQQDYYRRIYAKTASMFELAAASPALLALVDDNLVETARAFGNEIGMAFQIVDDVLDFTGEQATVGKPVASDLRQGLITLPALYYLEMHPDDPDMQFILDGNFYNDQIMDRIVNSIRQSGAITMAVERATQHVERGLELLNEFPDSEYRRALEDLAGFIVRRNL